MIKYETVADLAKSMGGLHGHLVKTAAHHVAMSDAHAAHSAFAKAQADGMADGHEMKATMNDIADHHDKCSKLHKAHADHCTSCAADVETAPTAKAAGGNPVSETVAAAAAPPAAAAPASDGVAEMLEQTKVELMKKAMASLKDDPTVAAELQKMVLEGIRAALGDKLVPDKVRGAVPEIPARFTPVPRDGGAPIDTSAVDPQFLHLVSMED